MPLSTWLAFAAASIVLLLIPGPTVVLVVTYALAQGRKVALAVAAGVALGDFAAMTVSVAGLGALLAASATLFTALKWIGAAYLVWLGIGLFRAPAVLPEAGAEPASRPAGRMFGHAFLVTALNPKSIAFFIAFVPHFISREAALLPQIAVLEATFVVLAGLNALAYAVAADLLRRQIRRPAVLKWLNRAGGTCLVGMGGATVALARG